MIWLWIALGVYLLASTLIVLVLCKAANLNLGLAGSALLVVLGPPLALVIMGLFFLGVAGHRRRERREEELGG